MLDNFTKSYLGCAMWSTNDESDESGGVPIENNYTIEDFAPEAIASAVGDCDAFREQAQDIMNRNNISDEQGGFDFWLTREGHGAGFWDRGNGDDGDTLTDMCEPFGEGNLCVGDDGRLHFMNE